LAPSCLDTPRDGKVSPSDDLTKLKLTNNAETNGISKDSEERDR